MSFIVIETHGGPEHATICTNTEGDNLVFNNRAAAQAEADNCQDGMVVSIGGGIEQVGDKRFIIKDKSGRGGFNGNATMEDLLRWPNEEDWHGRPLHEWLDECEEGNEWEHSTIKLMCIAS